MWNLNRRIRSGAPVVILCGAMMCPGISTAQDATTSPDWLRGPYLNVVLSIQHVDEMRNFYGEILGLESMPDIDLPARVGRPFDTIMIRYKVGPSQVKMIPHEGLSRKPGGRTAANGLRVLSVPVTDGDAIAGRLARSNGHEVEWQPAHGYQVAWVRDPDDNEVELRWYGVNATPEQLARLELSITTNDLDASARHYGEWLGLREIDPVDLTGFPGTTRRFVVGASALRLWNAGNALPVDTGWTKDGYGIRYVQFIVRDCETLHKRVRALGGTIAQEPTPLGTSTILLFLADPDGVINECVGPARPQP
jgi:catechol 2,3-dioxygenase-like lactoylglutathione lyase family enzyme